MTNLSTQVDLNNASRADANSQFNAQQEQQRNAIDAGNEQQANQLDAQLSTQVSQFNAQLDFNQEQFNTQNENAINQANAQWRRQVNTANTAGENQVNQANALNAFNLSNQALTFLWQADRDSASWEHQSAENTKEGAIRTLVAAMGNEAAADLQKTDLWTKTLEKLFSVG
jgi:hypothetical protein